MVRVLQGLYPTAAELFGEALAAGALLGSLQKDHARVNLQLECDGPIGGLFVDADAEGNVRGWVRRPRVHFVGDRTHGMRAALGGSGFLSVIRDLGSGQYYRSSVPLQALDLAEDLRRWFASSEQVGTAFDVAIVPSEGEPLGEVAGIVVQRLPDGDDAAVATARDRLAAGVLAQGLRRGASGQEIIAEACGAGFEVLADTEVAYRCGCSHERARVAVSALGVDGIAEVLAVEKQAEITCEFCRQRYVVAEPELREIARKLEARQGAG
jgi:molecular chaperone Hsp33